MRACGRSILQGPSGRSPPWSGRWLRRGRGPRPTPDGSSRRPASWRPRSGRASPSSRSRARSGVSLKTIYRGFSGKDGLLLAVFEEDNRVGADVLEQLIARRDDPVARLRAFIFGLFELATRPRDEDYIGLVMREYFRLSPAHSDRVEHVLTPFVDLLTREIEGAAAQGVLPAGDARRKATAVFLLTVAHLCPLVLADHEADTAATAAFVADFCLRALGALT